MDRVVSPGSGWLAWRPLGLSLLVHLGAGLIVIGVGFSLRETVVHRQPLRVTLLASGAAVGVSPSILNKQGVAAALAAQAAPATPAAKHQTLLQPQPQPQPQTPFSAREQPQPQRPLPARAEQNLASAPALPASPAAAAPQSASIPTGAATSTTAVTPKPTAAPEPASPNPGANANTPTSPEAPGDGQDLTPASADAAYLHNPKPDYPSVALRRHQEGTVRVAVLVSREGLPLSVRVETSSGVEQLDAAALAAVQHYRFVPARRGKAAVEDHVIVPVRFRLSELP